MSAALSLGEMLSAADWWVWFTWAIQKANPEQNYGNLSIQPGCKDNTMIKYFPGALLRYHLQPLSELEWKYTALWFLGKNSWNLFLLTAHQNRVSAITFCLASEWLISTGHDKCISWMCTRSGSMLGRHYFTSWASCLQYPLKNDCYPEAGRVLCSFTSICSQLFMCKN